MAYHASEFCLPGGEKPPNQFTIWLPYIYVCVCRNIYISIYIYGNLRHVCLCCLLSVPFLCSQTDVNQNNTVTDLDLTRLAIFITGGLHSKATD